MLLSAPPRAVYSVTRHPILEKKKISFECLLLVGAKNGRLSFIDHAIQQAKNSVKSEMPHLYDDEDYLKAAISYALDYQDEMSGDAAMHYGASFGSLSVVKKLILEGASLNIQNVRGDTPLIVAVCKGHIRIVEELILSKASLYVRNNDEKTALDYAKERGNDDIIDILENAQRQINSEKSTCSYESKKITFYS